MDGLHLEEATIQLVDALAQRTKVGMIVDDVAWSSGMHRAWRSLQQRKEWRVSFSWRGRGFLVKAPHMEGKRFVWRECALWLRIRIDLVFSSNFLLKID